MTKPCRVTNDRCGGAHSSLSESQDLNLGTPMLAPAANPSNRPLLLVAGAVGVLLAGTLLLWLWYGTAVFSEMVLAGLAACF
jgi:hypothetical protein